MKINGRPRLKTAVSVIVAVILIMAATLAVAYDVFISYKDPYHDKVSAAGFTEKRAQIGEVNFNYAEGPDNGPALLLLHAQHMDWYSYSRVLPILSETFHIFAVDYHGHGKTTAPVEYMYANQIGGDLAKFIESVIKEPVYVSGNSSGGILAAWLASKRPELIKAVVLEDPSLFSGEYPRVLDTIADKSFAICDAFVQENGDDFLLYWIENCRDFFKKYVGFDAAPLLAASITAYRDNNPGEAVEINYLPETVRLMMRGMNYYDPHFGAAFHNGTWNEGFDHAEALRDIKCPVLLLHANFEILEDGVFSGAIDQDEADRIVSLIPDCRYMRIDSEHVIHLDKPADYIGVIRSFFGA
ncbi:MAG: alpha/beta hydrolase [Clostridiales bacterium]|jgi:pimeloyl-ACP methyl ester carboxylesterase|nr:alpha/beta hydrolase [Clostridiales bacterium]